MFIKRNIEFIEVLLYLAIAVVLIYYVHSPFNKILFLGVLPLVWITKRDYLWLAFFFIVEDIPGGLFSGGLVDDPYRLPLYTIMPDISFSIRELYLMLLLLKTSIKPSYRRVLQKNFFRKELAILGYYLIGLLIVSAFLGMTYEGYRDFYKLSINLTLFISVPIILGNRYYFIRFLKILFPFAIVALLFQIYSLTFGQQLIALFKPDVLSVQGVLSSSGHSEEWQRPIEMVHVLLVCFVGSLFLLNDSNRNFRPTYLMAINIVSFIAIFLTGTRTWFLALGVVYIYFFFTRIRQVSFGVIKKVIIGSMIIVGISFIPIIKKQILNAWSRLSTLEMVAEGDLTAGGTASRFDVRAPRVMEGFLSSTIIAGAGFSKHYYEYADGHVGYHNMLLNTGIAGIILFALIIGKAFYLPHKICMSRNITSQAKQELRMSSSLLIALLIINIGTQTLGYMLVEGNRYLLMVLALVYINMSLNSILGSPVSQNNKQYSLGDNL